MLNVLVDAPVDAPAAAAAPAEIEPARLRAAELKALAQRSNGPALRQTLVHLGAISLTAVLLWQALGTVWALPLTLLLGYLQAFLFTSMHECAHQTAFRSRAGNTLLGQLSGLAIVLPFEYYRAFHWDHHRYTQDIDRDPELSTPLPAPGWPLLWYFSGLPTWRLGLGADGEEGFRVRVADDRRDQAVLDRHGEGDVHGAVVLNAGAGPRGVDAGDAAERLGAGFEDEIVDGEFHALLLQGGVELLADRKQRLGVDFDFQIKVRDLRLGLEEALGDDRPHVGGGDGAAFLDGAGSRET